MIKERCRHTTKRGEKYVSLSSLAWLSQASAATPPCCGVSMLLDVYVQDKNVWKREEKNTRRGVGGGINTTSACAPVDTAVVYVGTWYEGLLI